MLHNPDEGHFVIHEQKEGHTFPEVMRHGLKRGEKDLGRGVCVLVRQEIMWRKLIEPQWSKKGREMKPCSMQEDLGRVETKKSVCVCV